MPHYLHLNEITDRYGQRIAHPNVIIKARAAGRYPAPDLRIGALTANPVHGWSPERADQWITEELAAAEVDGVDQLAIRHLRFIETRSWWQTPTQTLVGVSDIIALCPTVDPQRIRRALARPGSTAQETAVRVGNRTGWTYPQAHNLTVGHCWSRDTAVEADINRIAQ